MLSAAHAAKLAAAHLDDDHATLLLVDLPALDARIGELMQAFPADALHTVAIKAFPVRAVLERMVAAGMGLEAASPAELELALSIAEPDRVVFDSPCKRTAEIARALETGVWLHVDSLQELERVVELDPGDDARVGLRVNPGLRPGTIAATSTATPGAKFGIDLCGHRDDILEAFAKFPWLSGLHVHVASQGGSLDLLAEGIDAIVALADEIDKAGGSIRWLDIGGGLPVDPEDPSRSPSFASYAALLRDRPLSPFDGGRRIITEFGRSLHGHTGFAITRVEYTKLSGGRRIAIAHTGADLFLRTAYAPDDWPLILDVFGPDGESKLGVAQPWDIAGPLCFSGDRIATDFALPHIDPGDLLVIHNATPYTLGMWSRYNSRCSPPVFGATPQGELVRLRAGESVDDVLRFWS